MLLTSTGNDGRLGDNVVSYPANRCTPPWIGTGTLDDGFNSSSSSSSTQQARALARTKSKLGRAGPGQQFRTVFRSGGVHSVHSARLGVFGWSEKSLGTEAPTAVLRVVCGTRRIMAAPLCSRRHPASSRGSRQVGIARANSIEFTQDLETRGQCLGDQPS